MLKNTNYFKKQNTSNEKRTENNEITSRKKAKTSTVLTLAVGFRFRGKHKSFKKNQNEMTRKPLNKVTLQ